MKRRSPSPYPPNPAYGEAPTTFQRHCVAVTLGLCAALVFLWIVRGPALDPDDSLLVGATVALLVTQWLALGLLLRPRGRGLRRNLGARLLAAAFGATHLVAGLMLSLFRIRDDPVRDAEGAIALYAMGALILGAAAQAHWAAAGGPSGTGRGPPD